MNETEDGHYVVIKGRRWRATDPLIPEDVAAVLRKQLMSARRAVKDAADDEALAAARANVQRAKVALGERGSPPWWEQSRSERQQRWQSGLA